MDSAPATAEHTTARELASGAGVLLVALREESRAADPRALGDEGDARAHAFLATQLAERHPDDAVLSEEAPDDRARLGAERVWIIDPLDGTREYTEPGRTDWAVHVALWRAGSLVAGAVALPALEAVYATDAPPDPPPPARRLRLVVSRTRPPAWAGAVAEDLGAEILELGSAGAKTMAVVRGEADAYLHDGGQFEWDVAAPAAVATAAGLHVCRANGAAPVFNKPEPRLPDLLVCHRDMADRLLRAIARRRTD
ncbi:MAG TPA: inositol monophosphatase family protein [Egibacteraceae bacterium]|nr:inositol monophosphatase family protein [Egibacteraceae bacterium]